MLCNCFNNIIILAKTNHNRCPTFQIRNCFQVTASHCNIAYIAGFNINHCSRLVGMHIEQLPLILLSWGRTVLIACAGHVLGLYQSS